MQNLSNKFSSFQVFKFSSFPRSFRIFCTALIARAGIADDEFVAISGIKDYLSRISGAGLDWLVFQLWFFPHF
jgi:hypothetical protein